MRVVHPPSATQFLRIFVSSETCLYKVPDEDHDRPKRHLTCRSVTWLTSGTASFSASLKTTTHSWSRCCDSMITGRPFCQTQYIQTKRPMALVHDFEIRSISLAETRKISVYLPPSYRRRRHLWSSVLMVRASADLRNACNERCKPEGSPRSCLLAYTATVALAEDYIVGRDQAHFAAHEQFFADEVHRWSDSEFGVGAARVLRRVRHFPRSCVRDHDGRKTSFQVRCCHCLLDTNCRALCRRIRVVEFSTDEVLSCCRNQRKASPKDHASCSQTAHKEWLTRFLQSCRS